jgi:hypothetical protein
LSSAASLGHAKATMIAVTIGITMKTDGTIAVIAMSIATDRIREGAAVRVDDVQAVVLRPKAVREQTDAKARRQKIDIRY